MFEDLESRRLEKGRHSEGLSFGCSTTEGLGVLRKVVVRRAQQLFGSFAFVERLGVRSVGSMFVWRQRLEERWTRCSAFVRVGDWRRGGGILMNVE